MKTNNCQSLSIFPGQFIYLPTVNIRTINHSQLVRQNRRTHTPRNATQSTARPIRQGKKSKQLIDTGELNLLCDFARMIGKHLIAWSSLKESNPFYVERAFRKSTKSASNAIYKWLLTIVA